MVARYPGSVCARCRNQIAVGDSIERVPEGRGYRHQNCDDPHAEPRGPKNPEAPMTQPQRELIGRLALERVRPETVTIPAAGDEVTQGEASRIIDTLLDAPKAMKMPLPGADVVPAGRYALPVEFNGEERVVLVRVWRGSRNPSFVRTYDDDSGSEIDKRDTLRRLVEAGPIECARRYGQLRCRCARCNKKLRNRLSLELSIGPECLKYWYSADRVTAIKDAARRAIRARGEDPNETVYSAQEPEQLELLT